MISAALKRFLILVAMLLILGGAVFLLANPGGWRARIITRLMRVENYPQVIALPPDFHFQVPAGFKVSVLAGGFQRPRWLAVAPDGGVFVADSTAGQVIVLHESEGDPSNTSREVFAEGLNLPFGIAFQNDYVYVANTNEVVRFRFDPKTSKRLGNSEHILDLPGLGYHGHWTRSLAFSADGRRLFVSVGSETNISIEKDSRRAAILSIDPDGSNMRVFASGLRNAVGIAVNPETAQLWAAVNERDDLGEDLPSDFFTQVVENGFYGWPYSYLGQHVDNRVSARPDLIATAITPELLLGAHVAPLQAAFYDKQQFPSEYANGAFIAEHGSSNRRIRTGYVVDFVPFHAGRPSGSVQAFMTGFLPDASRKEVYGCPVGVAVNHGGSLLVSDDCGKVIWKISYKL